MLLTRGLTLFTCRISGLSNKYHQQSFTCVFSIEIWAYWIYYQYYIRVLYLWQLSSMQFNKLSCVFLTLRIIEILFNLALEINPILCLPPHFHSPSFPYHFPAWNNTAIRHSDCTKSVNSFITTLLGITGLYTIK